MCINININIKMGVAIGPKKRNLIAAVAAFADCFLGRKKKGNDRL